MVQTPELPLKYRRKGCPDIRLDSPDPDSDLDMPYSSPLSTSYSSFSDFDFPRSPTFCSSSSSAAPSSPIRALYTPEPSSSPLAEPHIASSPKSFWEVAVNYGPEHPYKIKSRPMPAHKSPATRTHRHMGSRGVSNATVPFHSLRDVSEFSEEGEMDVASVLLDLKRGVRVWPISSDAQEHVEPKITTPPNEICSPSVGDPSSTTIEQNMDMDTEEAPAKTEGREQRAACCALDTNQINPGEISSPAVLVPDVSQIPESTITNFDATTNVASDQPAVIPHVDNPGTSLVNDDSKLEPEMPICIADVEPITDEMVVVAPVTKDTLPMYYQGLDPASEPSQFRPDLSALSPLSSPAFSSPLLNASEPLSELPSPISHPLILDECEDNWSHDEVGRVEIGELGGRPSPAYASDSTDRESESPLAGPSKLRTEAPASNTAATKRRCEEDAPTSNLHSDTTVSASSSSATEKLAKEKKKRQRCAKDDQPLTTSSSSAKGTGAPKPRKRQPKKLKDGAHETSKRANLPLAGASTPDNARANTEIEMIKEDDSSRVESTETLQRVGSGAAESDSVSVSEQDRSEIAGLLVQTMALSRASSMPPSCLLRDVFRENPHLVDRRSKDAWLVLINSVLGHHDYFGKIEREGLDADDKPLETQWFYIPENDTDQDRASLLREMMPKKRTATKKHKQYFYKPLGKISRWDPEDAL